MAKHVDLDDYATPTNAPATQAARREALLAQLGWLTVEAEALGPLLAALPPEVLSGRPMPDARSVKETFGLFATLDREIHTPQIERILNEEAPVLRRSEEETLVEGNGWNDTPLDALLSAMRDARQALLDRLTPVPADDWQRSAVFETDSETETMSLSTYVLHICQHDADRLRDLAYRLHESKLTRRTEDLPK